MNKRQSHHPLTVIIALLIALLAVSACGGGPAPAATAPPAGEPPAPPIESAGADPLPSAQPPTPPEANLTGCVERYSEGIDYFPDKVTLDYAEGLTITYFDHYKVIDVPSAWPGGGQSFRYVLVQCGTPPPAGYDDAVIIEVPAGRVVSMSTTYITQMDDLGVLDRLAGLDSFAYVSNPAVRARIDAGELVEVAPNLTPNVEVALELDPDVIFAFSSGAPEYDVHPAFLNAGLPVVMNADWLERTPLARAEWIKFIAAFFNAEAQANAVFENIEAQYQQAAALAAGAEQRPTVFTSLPYQGTWYMPGGASFVARLIADAGGDYIYADDESTGSLFLDFETVYDAAKDADIWLDVAFVATLADLQAADARYADFNAFQQGNVYAYDARSSEYGLEYFETSSARPHVVLLDLVHIFHPELLPDHELYYYRRLE
ncbi:MAG: ABC transporter substrate-binding protein [Anaerolineae bacterium]